MEEQQAGGTHGTQGRDGRTNWSKQSVILTLT